MSRRILPRWFGLMALISCALYPGLALAAAPETVATFSIVGYDPATGELGIAVESKFFSVGSVVPWAKAGVGAVATQSYANTQFGPRGLHLMEMGFSAQEALDILVKSDEGADQRQLGVVDAKGSPATFTGKKCTDWAGGKTGQHYAAQGNILTGPEVVTAMASSFESSEGKPLADRLVQALAAGQEAGGDARGRQSAALLVVREKGGYGGYNDRYIDLRVEDHARPIVELQRLLDLHHVINAYYDGLFYLERGEGERAIELMEEATRKAATAEKATKSDQGDAYYNLACFYSRAEMVEKALESLEKAFALNPALVPLAHNDTDLDPLRDHARFRRMIQDGASDPD